MVYEFTATDDTAYFFGLHLVSSDDYRYVLNAHGDVVALVNASGAVTKRYEYDAFGVELNPDEADTNPYRYCAEYFDIESGTIYLRARYYSPNHGRFTQLDPARDGLNWYAYCANNPILFVDPTGCILQFDKDATNEEKEQYNRTIEYLKQSDTAKALIEKLEKSDTVFTIKFTDENTKFSIKDKTIQWNESQGVILSNEEDVMSPAMSLSHEMGHAAQYLDGTYTGKEKQKDRDRLEKDNLEKYETPIASDLGEPKRSDYYDVIAPINVPTSTDYGKASKVKMSFWEKINPVNWFKPTKYTFTNENTWKPGESKK